MWERKFDPITDTSIKHSPNFDWVVAHVGSCFPNTVITRVLSCGLKDFCQNKSYEQGCESPKLKSVVGILGHLASTHEDNIRAALLDIFKVRSVYQFNGIFEVRCYKFETNLHLLTQFFRFTCSQLSILKFNLFQVEFIPCRF